MVDYYPILARAMSAPEARDPQWRRGVYERARQMLVTQLLARRPATPPDAIAAEQSGLDAAIRRIEAEMSRPARARERQAPIEQAPIDQADEDIADPSASAPDQGPLKTPLRLSSISLFAVAVVASAIGAGGYMFWVQHAHKASPPAKMLPPPPLRKRRPRPKPRHPSLDDQRRRSRARHRRRRGRYRPAVCFPPPADVLSHAAAGRHHHHR